MYFYHNTTRNIHYAFYSLFNNIEIRRFDKDNELVSKIKVPITLASKEKGVVTSDTQPDNKRKVGAVVPAMTYELTSKKTLYHDQNNRNEVIQTRYVEASIYDSSAYPGAPDGELVEDKTFDDRQLFKILLNAGTPTERTIYYVRLTDPSGLQMLSDSEGNPLFKTHYTESFAPVIQDLTFHLHITTRTQSDLWQIIEQITPRFTPDYNLALNLFPHLNLDRPINIQITKRDPEIDFNWSGPIANQRLIKATIPFDLKVPYFASYASPTNIIFKNITKINKLPDGRTLSGEACIAESNTKVIFNTTDNDNGYIIDSEWTEYDDAGEEL